MDNFSFRMTSQGSLKPIMSIIFAKNNAKSVGYAIREAKPKGEGAWDIAKPLRMVFFQYDSAKYIKDFVSFPFTMDSDGAADFAERWLRDGADYGREPDHDGDNGKGWTVYNEGWGQVDSEYQAFVAVSPSWAMYGK